MSVWGKPLRESANLVFKPFRIDPDRDEKLIVMVVVSTLRADPRVERAAKTAVKRGYRVVVICPDISAPTHAEEPIDWGPGIEFDLTPFDTASFVMNPPYSWSDALYEKAKQYKPAAFHANDLFTTLSVMRAAQDVGSPVLVDFHEWHAENVQRDKATREWVQHPPLEKRMFRLFERVALWRAHKMVTVCKSIAHEMEEMALRPRDSMDIIRNIPPLKSDPTRDYPPLKEQIGLDDDKFLIVYQGGIGATRKLEPIIRGLAYAPKAHLLIRGPGMQYEEAGYKAVAEEAGVADRLILRDGVPSADVVAAAVGADAGLWSLPNISKNFYYALPNKIWEYLAAGLPILVADFPEARAVAKGHNVGLTFDSADPASVGAAMREMSENPELVEQMKNNVPRALDRLDVSREWDKLVDLYDDMAAMKRRKAG
jgi:glycosyltransferase involved in cell wall biosynthesis